MKIKCFDCFKEYEQSDSSSECPFCGYASSGETIKPGENCLPAGTLLDNRYIIGRKCGQGGFGITYKSWDCQLEQIVAVKEYFPSALVNRVPGTTMVLLSSGNEKKRREFRKGMERYIEEARIMARYVSHENIVNVYGYFEENDTAYIVMEYMDGLGLDKYLRQLDDRRTDCDTAVDITLGICNALKTIHSEGIVHRDISPDNIFLCTNGKYKLFDFGASRLAGEDKSKLTIILKPGYAPPEQYTNLSAQGPQTDIYALGATMYRMLTGKMPPESMNRKIKDGLIPPSGLCPDIPEYLSDIIMKAMAIEPELRFKSADELAEALRKELKVELPENSLKKIKKHSKLRTGIIAAAAVIACGFAAVKFFYNSSVQHADIEVWYINDENMDLTMNDIGDEFKRIYSDISISFNGIERTNYENELIKAEKEGNMPDVYQSDTLNTDAFETASLKNIIRDTGKNVCYFIGDNSDMIDKNGKLPLGFNIPVCYLNTVNNTYSGNTLNSVNDVLSDKYKLSVSENLKDMFEKISFIEKNSASQNVSDFLSGKTDMLLSDTSVFYDVQKALPARSKMLEISNQEVSCIFTDCWSIYDNGKSSQLTASEEFLKFLLSSASQDYLYIRNSGSALPLNITAFQEYCKVHTEFEDILSVVKIGDYSFK